MSYFIKCKIYAENQCNYRKILLSLGCSNDSTITVYCRITKRNDESMNVKVHTIIPLKTLTILTGEETFQRQSTIWIKFLHSGNRCLENCYV